MITSKDIELEEVDVDLVAGMLPKSWKEAVASYLDTRRKKLTSGLLDVKEFEAKTQVQHAHALTALSAFLGTEFKDKPKIRIEAPTKNQGEHYISLASLLCPPGWRDKVRPILNMLAAQASQAIIDVDKPTMPCMPLKEKADPEKAKYVAQVGEGQSIGLHQAIAKETQRLLRFLENTEKKAGDAAMKKDRESRGFGSPVRQQGSLVRAMI